ncbi:ATP-dependent DNA helicase, partial [Frankliniella fusca]
KDVVDLKGESLQQFQEKMKNVKFLIIEEFSMVGCRLLNIINRRCMQMKSSNEPFGALPVYMFGDLNQLPPIGDTPLYSLNVDYYKTMAYSGSLLFKSMVRTKFLSVAHRQCDGSFLNFLDNLSRGYVSPSDQFYISDRFEENMDVEEIQSFNHAVHLFQYVKETEACNKRKLLELGRPIIKIEAKNNNSYAKCSSDDLACNLQNYLEIAIGARVMLRSNLWTEGGLVNGCVGYVEDVIFCDELDSASPSFIFVKFESYYGPTLENGCVPITRIMKSWSVNNIHCTRFQFPLTLAYAITIHKCQGLTLRRMVLHFDSAEIMSGIFYVAMSRVREKSDLMIAGSAINSPLFRIKASNYSAKIKGKSWLMERNSDNDSLSSKSEEELNKKRPNKKKSTLESPRKKTGCPGLYLIVVDYESETNDKDSSLDGPSTLPSISSPEGFMQCRSHIPKQHQRATHTSEEYLLSSSYVGVDSSSQGMRDHFIIDPSLHHPSSSQQSARRNLPSEASTSSNSTSSGISASQHELSASRERQSEGVRHTDNLPSAASDPVSSTSSGYHVSEHQQSASRVMQSQGEHSRVDNLSEDSQAASSSISAVEATSSSSTHGAAAGNGGNRRHNNTSGDDQPPSSSRSEVRAASSDATSEAEEVTGNLNSPSPAPVPAHLQVQAEGSNARERFNNRNQQVTPLRKCSELIPGRRYQILEISRTNTQYGPAIRATIIDDRSPTGRTHLPIQQGGRLVLYPGLHQSSKRFLEEVLASGSKTLAGEIYNFDIPQLFLQDIFNALRLLDEICSGCDGDHSLWVLAGGFVAFLLGKTSCFSDIDIFVNCNKDQLDWESYSVFDVTFDGRLTIQIICVNFNVNFFHRRVHDITIWDMFSAYVILDFDLPICRCAMKFLSSGCYVMDLSAFDLYPKDIRVNRRKKYISRMLPHIRHVPSLQQQVLFHIIVKYCLSHENFTR